MEKCSPVLSTMYTVTYPSYPGSFNLHKSWPRFEVNQSAYLPVILFTRRSSSIANSITESSFSPFLVRISWSCSKNKNGSDIPTQRRWSCDGSKHIATSTWQQVVYSPQHSKSNYESYKKHSGTKPRWAHRSFKTFVYLSSLACEVSHKLQFWLARWLQIRWKPKNLYPSSPQPPNWLPTSIMDTNLPHMLSLQIFGWTLFGGITNRSLVKLTISYEITLKQQQRERRISL